jgi:hypothetical protein
LYDQFQDELVSARYSTDSFEFGRIYGICFNLISMQEHDDRPLPIYIRTLGHYAAKCYGRYGSGYVSRGGLFGLRLLLLFCVRVLTVIEFGFY